MLESSPRTEKDAFLEQKTMLADGSSLEADGAWAKGATRRLTRASLTHLNMHS